MQVLQAAFSFPVADAKRTHDFYKGVFGADACERDAEVVTVTLPGSQIFFIQTDEFNFLLKPAEVEAVLAPGLNAAMLSVTVATRDDAYAILKLAADAGGKPCGQAVPYPWGLAAYFTDPDGHLVEAIWRG
ncbi:VOC family protein [Turneriella parva]|uniref:Glyoxalase/bleomycin resistance protein/dioxygenase n=1 Tax=Turneriella parva (strain ATCC BAA-1111 / DSM 21527 / NCTC 11395 / H) TaxID=869212 RepID=I4B499_TURPD|nr:VOC family protein [Turneriella parva]AFM12106.1 Glyoxalase/bleomycin resistance protein/dioxygenase [Turneriella parva DSM 21527]